MLEYNLPSLEGMYVKASTGDILCLQFKAHSMLVIYDVIVNHEKIGSVTRIKSKKFWRACGRDKVRPAEIADIKYESACKAACGLYFHLMEKAKHAQGNQAECETSEKRESEVQLPEDGTGEA